MRLTYKHSVLSVHNQIIDRNRRGIMSHRYRYHTCLFMNLCPKEAERVLRISQPEVDVNDVKVAFYSHR